MVVNVRIKSIFLRVFIGRGKTGDKKKKITGSGDSH